VKSHLESSDLWASDPEQAVLLNKKFVDLEKQYLFYKNLEDDLLFFIEAKESGEKLIEEDVQKRCLEIQKILEEREWLLLLTGEYDQKGALLSIHAGTGGTDAQDWAEILLRMYLRFSEQQAWEVKILNKQDGNEAGIKRVELAITGDNVFGLLKAEAGIHRLVRISPFDAEAMRHTSFASVEVEPKLEQIELKDFIIPADEIKTEVFRAGGHGGQGVNTTDSAVRMIHIPTKITVVCQNERSQMQNKITAEKILKSRVYYYQEEEKRKERDLAKGELKMASWGNQIRSYVFHPYQQIKDHRTNYVEKNITKVLDGDLLPFIKAYLQIEIRKQK